MEKYLMPNQPQKPGEKPQKPGPYVEINPQGKPVNPPNPVVAKPDTGHLPPTKKPGDSWKPKK